MHYLTDSIILPEAAADFSALLTALAGVTGAVGIIGIIISILILTEKFTIISFAIYLATAVFLTIATVAVVEISATEKRINTWYEETQDLFDKKVFVEELRMYKLYGKVRSKSVYGGILIRGETYTLDGRVLQLTDPPTAETNVKDAAALYLQSSPEQRQQIRNEQHNIDTKQGY